MSIHNYLFENFTNHPETTYSDQLIAGNVTTLEAHRCEIYNSQMKPRLIDSVNLIRTQARALIVH